MASEQPTGRPLTYGEKLVGITFNPGGSPEVNTMKRMYAGIIDDLNNAAARAETSEQKRHYSIAITEAQTAQMWAVKALTFQH